MLGASKLMLGSATSNFGNSTVSGNVTSGAFYSNTVSRSTYLTFLNTITYEAVPSTGISSITSTFGNLIVTGNTAVVDILLVGAGGPSVSTTPANCNGGGGGEIRFYSNVIVPPGVYPLQVNKPKKSPGDGTAGANGIATLTIGGTVYQANPGSDGSAGGTLRGGAAGGGARSTSTLYGAAGFPIYNFGYDVTWIGGLGGNIWYGAGGSGVTTNTSHTNTVNAGGTNTGGAGQDPQGYSPTASSACYGIMHTGGGAGGGINANGATYENVPGTGVIIIRQISPITSYTVNFLAIGGGGGGGTNTGGGGGAGGYVNDNFTATPNTTYTITIGAGGAGGASSSSGATGGNTTISGADITTVTARGGGGGGYYQVAGLTGGSGGGGGYTTTGGSAVSGQGNAGGDGSGSDPTVAYGGGGGGATSAGGNANKTGPVYGAGGNALFNSITGANVSYAGGGGGGGYGGGTGSATAGLGGGTTTSANKGGGGDGKTGNPTGAYPDNSNAVGLAGTANSGGGQGGGTGGNFNNNYTDSNGAAGAGGSGVVILSVPTSNYSGTYTGTVTVTTSGSNTILKFTTSGTYTG